MPCERFDVPGGGTAIICGPGVKPQKCVGCSAPATNLCDAGKGGKIPAKPTKRNTCSAPVCDRCTTVVGDEQHLCPGHAGIECEHGVVPFHACKQPCSFCKSNCGRHRPAWPACPM